MCGGDRGWYPYPEPCSCPRWLVRSPTSLRGEHETRNEDEKDEEMHRGLLGRGQEGRKSDGGVPRVITITNLEITRTAQQWKSSQGLDILKLLAILSWLTLLYRAFSLMPYGMLKPRGQEATPVAECLKRVCVLFNMFTSCTCTPCDL